MSKIIITIETDNDAFQEDMEQEVQWVLSQVKRALNSSSKTLKDSNGNTVGTVKVEED